MRQSGKDDHGMV